MNNAENIKIDTEYIKLSSLLKFAALVSSGGEAKDAILEGLVLLNGEICLLRGKKIFPGDIIEYSGKTIKVS